MNKLLAMLWNFFQYRYYIFMRNGGYIYDFGVKKWILEPSGMYSAAIKEAIKQWTNSFQ